MNTALAVLVSCLMLVGTASTAAAQTYSATTSTGATIIPGVTDIGNHCDDCNTAIVLPFPVALYGASFNNANIASNGSVQFSSNNTSFTNTALPNAAFSNTVFAFWDDLITTPAGTGIFTSLSGPAGDQTFVIEWRTGYFSGGGTANFEVLFYEGEDFFDVVYGAMTQTATGTLGVQDGVSDFTQVAFNGTGQLPSNGLRITYTPTVPEPFTAALLATGVGMLLIPSVRKRLSR